MVHEPKTPCGWGRWGLAVSGEPERAPKPACTSGARQRGKKNKSVSQPVIIKLGGVIKEALLRSTWVGRQVNKGRRSFGVKSNITMAPNVQVLTPFHPA